MSHPPGTLKKCARVVFDTPENFEILAYQKNRQKKNEDYDGRQRQREDA
jgi:hypothetical protein